MSRPDELERRADRRVDSGGVDQHRLVVAVARDEAPPLIVATQVGLHPDSGCASFLACVIDGPLPVVISELECPVPDQGWELRSSGLWVDHICETPFEHWSYGLEAFALAIDDPSELLGRGFGERLPLGWELEFEATDEPDLTSITPTLDSPPGAPAVGADGVDVGGRSGWYRQLGTVHGLLLDASGETEIEGRAIRSHRWGEARFSPEGLLADGSSAGDDPIGAATYDLDVALPGVDEIWWITRTPAGVRTRTEYGSSR